LLSNTCFPWLSCSNLTIRSLKRKFLAIYLLISTALLWHCCSKIVFYSTSHEASLCWLESKLLIKSYTVSLYFGRTIQWHQRLESFVCHFVPWLITVLRKGLYHTCHVNLSFNNPSTFIILSILSSLNSLSLNHKYN